MIIRTDWALESFARTVLSDVGYYLLGDQALGLDGFQIAFKRSERQAQHGPGAPYTYEIVEFTVRVSSGDAIAEGDTTTQLGDAIATALAALERLRRRPTPPPDGTSF